MREIKAQEIEAYKEQENKNDVMIWESEREIRMMRRFERDKERRLVGFAEGKRRAIDKWGKLVGFISAWQILVWIAGLTHPHKRLNLDGQSG